MSENVAAWKPELSRKLVAWIFAVCEKITLAARCEVLKQMATAEETVQKATDRLGTDLLDAWDAMGYLEALVESGLLRTMH